MKTQLDTSITVEQLCDGFVYNELEEKACLVYQESLPFSPNINAIIFMQTVRKMWQLSSQY